MAGKSFMFCSFFWSFKVFINVYRTSKYITLQEVSFPKCTEVFVKPISAAVCCNFDGVTGDNRWICVVTSNQRQACFFWSNNRLQNLLTPLARIPTKITFFKKFAICKKTQNLPMNEGKCSFVYWVNLVMKQIVGKLLTIHNFKLHFNIVIFELESWNSVKQQTIARK